MTIHRFAFAFVVVGFAAGAVIVLAFGATVEDAVSNFLALSFGAMSMVIAEKLA